MISWFNLSTRDIWNKWSWGGSLRNFHKHRYEPDLILQPGCFQHNDLTIIRPKCGNRQRKTNIIKIHGKHWERFYYTSNINKTRCDDILVMNKNDILLTDRLQYTQMYILNITDSLF